MKILISWSGERGKTIAQGLRYWLEDVHPALKPWLSAEDLEPGMRWNSELAKQLEETHFGIICITPESLYSPWQLFEAGALAKALDRCRVCPYLFQLEPSDLPAPLAQFEAVSASQLGTLKLIRTINHSLDKELLYPEDRLRKHFDKWWPDLQSILTRVPDTPTHTELPILRADSLGLERICRTRAEALFHFALALRKEAQRDRKGKSVVYVTGTSLKGFMVPATEGFDGPKLLKDLVDSKCLLRLMLTHPKVADRRAKQEKRHQGDIASDVRASVEQLLGIGVSQAHIRYYKGSPTMFGIATTEKMLLNPYPYESESRKCMSLIIRKTEDSDDIYHQYLPWHFENPWNNAVPIDQVSTFDIPLDTIKSDYKE